MTDHAKGNDGVLERLARSICGALGVLALLPLASGSVAAQQAQDVNGTSSGVVTVAADRGLNLGRIQASEIGLGAAPVEAVVDGRLTEPFWSAGQVATGFIQQSPDEGSPATQRTQVRLFVDDGALYVGAQLFDDQPDAIEARLARRDEAVQSDWFYLYLDSYNDGRTAFAFGVNAAGVQRDLRVFEETREDPTWDAVWASSVRVTSDGWTVEMRIPLSQLRFSAGASGGEWGVNFLRQISRRNESSHWAPVAQGSDRFVSLFARLRGVEDLTPPSGIEVVPYTVARLTRAPGNPADPFYQANDPFGSVGADFRMGLGSSLTLSGTLNPDFGQVEADPATVNLTGFETFQQERRPFFVEGADIFRLELPPWPPFFYSRRIGRSPQGPTPGTALFQDRPRASTILGAVKVSGKTDSGWSIGVMDAVTQQERVQFVEEDGSRGSEIIEPRTNYAVARIGRSFRGGESNIGSILTGMNRGLAGTQLDFLHDAAYGAGLDGYHRFGDGAYVVQASVLASHVRGSARALVRTQRSAGHYFQRPDADHLQLDSARTSLTGISATARVQRVVGSWRSGLFGQLTSSGYEIADFGFNPELDQRDLSAWLRYEDFTPGRVFRSWNLGSFVQSLSTGGGGRRELTNDLGFFFQLLNYWRGGVWVMRHRPAWHLTALRGGPALRRPGRWMGSFDFSSDVRKTLSGNAFLFWMQEDDTPGHQTNLSGRVTVRPSDRFDVRLGPTVSWAHSAWQFIGRRNVDSELLNLVGGLDRRTVSLETRFNYTFTPGLSLQVYARPFMALGEYQEFREVADPGADSFEDRFRTYRPSELSTADGAVSVDRNGDGTSDLQFREPSFNFGSVQMNSVLRWEYRPGSTVFVVWTHDRNATADPNPDLVRDLKLLWDTPARNVFMVKVSYWLGR